jgi:phosphatidylglycerol---prolipoprotein diacylglyceryl transferase
MTNVLAYFPSPPQGVWHLWILPIRAYALFIIAGIVAALVIGDRRWQARGGQPRVIYDIALWAVPFGLVGGRLYHLATDWRTYWGPEGAGFWAALRIWDGGLGIWGAVAFGGVGAWIACRRRGIPLPAFGDAIAPGIILAQAIGRLGNYFNQELYGRETTVPWGLKIFYRRDPSGYIDPHSLDGVSTGQLAYVVQPTFLYELIWNLLVFVALIYLDRRFKLGHGRLFALYVAGYCVGRFGVELLRNDAATLIAGIRINVFTSTFVFIGAVVYVILAPKGREDPESLRGDYVPEKPEQPAPEPADEPATVAKVKVRSAATAAAAAAAVEDDESADSVEAGEAAEDTEAQTAEGTEAETAEPETAEAAADTAKADAGEPKAEEPESTEPEALEPEVAEPDAVEPEVAEPEVAEAEVAEPEVAEPEVAEAEVAEPEVAEAEVAEPVDAEAEAAVAEAGEPEVAEGDVEEPEDADSEAVVAEAAEAEVAEPPPAELEAEPEAAKAAEPEVADAEAEEPEIEPAAEADNAPEESAEDRSPAVRARSAVRRLSLRLRNRGRQ